MHRLCHFCLAATAVVHAEFVAAVAQFVEHSFVGLATWDSAQQLSLAAAVSAPEFYSAPAVFVAAAA